MEAPLELLSLCLDMGVNRDRRDYPIVGQPEEGMKQNREKIEMAMTKKDPNRQNIFVWTIDDTKKTISATVHSNGDISNSHQDSGSPHHYLNYAEGNCKSVQPYEILQIYLACEKH